jgi:hypothetical protein
VNKLAIGLLSTIIIAGCGASDDDYQVSCTPQADFEVCLGAGRLNDTTYGEGEFDALLTYSYYTPQQTPLGYVEKVYLSNGDILEHYPGFSEEYTNEDLEPMAVGLESEWKYAITEAC